MVDRGRRSFPAGQGQAGSAALLVSKDAGAATAAVALASAVAQSVYSHSRATMKSSAQAAARTGTPT